MWNLNDILILRLKPYAKKIFLTPPQAKMFDILQGKINPYFHFLHHHSIIQMYFNGARGPLLLLAALSKEVELVVVSGYSCKVNSKDNEDKVETFSRLSCLQYQIWVNLNT